MSQLVEALGIFFGRVEILARGAENDRRAAEVALARDRPLEAREHARAMLEKIPGSPVALALWADAAEAAWLDAEVAQALGALSQRVPWRADVWLRLGRAALRAGDPAGREALERAAAAPEEREAARLALLDLCDLDLGSGDLARAQRWLDSVPTPLSGPPDAAVALRRAECAVLRGDVEEAAAAVATWGDALEELPTRGRASFVRARLAALRGETAAPGPARAAAMAHAVRAYLLEAPGARDLLAWLVAASRDAVEVAELREIVAGMGELSTPSWEAAFALAEGRREEARAALARALGAGQVGAAEALSRLALEARDPSAIEALAAHGAAHVPPELSAIHAATAALSLAEEGDAAAAVTALDALGEALTPAVSAWADELRARAARSLTAGPVASWPTILAELARAARLLDREDRRGAIEALALEGERPLRAAVVGEFNAGKSTFLNALLGVDVAPTGILPTTATLHWVSWAPDPFARVVVRGGQDRVVGHEGLKGALAELADAGQRVARVHIYAPIERLRLVEVIDTPGFNAPDPEHGKAARSAFEEAHVVLWLLDATQPLKESERRVMDEARALGLPILALLNKGDRLREGEAPRILDHVREGLREAGIRTFAEPIVFSARLSLRGRLGDADALEKSRWGEVEALLSTTIVDRADSLRERALRRRAAQLMDELATTASERASLEEEAAEASARALEARRRAAATLSSSARDLAARLDADLAPVARALASDLRPLAGLPPAARTDPAIVGYVATRFVDRFALPVADALAREAKVPVTADVLDAVRAVLAGAAAAVDPASDAALDARPRVWMAVVLAFARALDRGAHVASGGRTSRALAARLRALGAALAADDEAAAVAGGGAAAPGGAAAIGTSPAVSG